jgi:hypothetical protein
MAVRDDFTAGEVLAAADLNDTFASKPPFAYGTATPSTTVEGFIWYDENDTPPAPKFWDGSAFETFGGGKVLQVVRATDSTLRNTTSTSYVDITGVSVTITPTKNTSAILLILTGYGYTSNSNIFMALRITDSSNNAISGAQQYQVGGSNSGALDTGFTLVGYATPATTSAVTYKGRFKTTAGTATVQNDQQTMQLYAIEVSA